jgi:hypothetical protein
MAGTVTVQLRREELSDRAAVAVRGGTTTLSDELIHRAALISVRELGFPSISVFVATDGDVAAMVERVGVLWERPKLRLARVGDLRTAGFPLLATKGAPHYSVVLPDVASRTLDRLRSCFSEPMENPGHRPGVRGG